VKFWFLKQGGVQNLFWRGHFRDGRSFGLLELYNCYDCLLQSMITLYYQGAWFAL